MARYKISKGNLKEFFGLFKSNKPKDREAIDKMIAKHPGLIAIDKELARLNKKAGKIISKDKDYQDFLKRNNIDIKNTFK